MSADPPYDLHEAHRRMDGLQGQIRAQSQFLLNYMRFIRMSVEREQDEARRAALIELAHAGEWAVAKLALPGTPGDPMHNGFETVADLLNRARLDVPLSVPSDAPVRQTDFRFPD